MNKTILATAAFLGLTGIILGAFAAHGLENLVETKSIESFKTGVRYQMYHAFLQLIIGATSFLSFRVKKWVFILSLLGVILFSGSIYVLATNNLSHFNFKSIAFVTPIGGGLLIIAWIVVFISILRNKNADL